MAVFVPKRPWWKRWLPVICWRHLRIVRRGTFCQRCIEDDRTWLKALVKNTITLHKAEKGER